MSSPDLIAELDALFGKAAQAKPKTKGKKPNFLVKGLTHSPTVEYWEPVAVVLWQSHWQCVCGCEGECAPQLMLRERKGRYNRLVSITRSTQYASLPRELERAEAVVVHDCPTCFQPTPFDQPQMELPLGAVEDLHKFTRDIEEGLLAGVFAETVVDPRNYMATTHSPDLTDLRMKYIARSSDDV